MKGQEVIRTIHLAIGHAKPLLLGLNLQVNAGELIAMIGPNGSGKSTLLRTLAGRLAPHQGQVLLHDNDLHRIDARTRARHISEVLTGRPPAGMLRVRELVRLGRHPWTDRWGRLKPVDDEAVDQAMERTGTLQWAERPLSELSDGMGQLVMIARALAQGAELMLLDEPTSFLDVSNRSVVMRTLRSIAHDDGRSVILATHDLQLAMDLCDRIWLLGSDGTIWQGTSQEAVSSGRVEAAFGTHGIRVDTATGAVRYKA